MHRSYFRLDDPIDEIYDDISRRDLNQIAKLVLKYPVGCGILTPTGSPWECMVAYIARPGLPTHQQDVERKDSCS